jgi:hypothetical protein
MFWKTEKYLLLPGPEPQIDQSVTQVITETIQQQQQ